MESSRIALTDIHADESFNSRTNYEKIGELAVDIKKNGQMNPLLVTPRSQGGYSLIAGFRRYKALQVNKADSASVQIVTYDGDDTAKMGSAKLDNLAENITRHSLTPYEIAISCKALQDGFGYTGTAIARRLASGEGMSTSHVNNLLSALENLDNKILEAWQNGNPLASCATLFKLKKLPKDEQIAEWEIICGNSPETLGTDAAGEGEGAREPAQNTVKPPNKNSVKSARQAVKDDAKLGESERDGMLAVFDFCLGIKKTLRSGTRVIYDPKAAAKAKAAEKAAAKEAAESDAEASDSADE